MFNQPDVNDAHGVGVLFTEPKLEDQLNTWPWDDTKYSIGQLALGSQAGLLRENWIEFGWIVDKTLFGDVEPHLFIFLRKKALVAFLTYCSVGLPNNNPCSEAAYVPLSAHFPVSPDNKLGEPVGKTGQPMMYHVGYYGENACGGDKGWWIQYGDEWIGCVKASWFGSLGFANGNAIQWFGEVVYGTDPCVPMGNGLKGSSSGSLSIANMFYERMQRNQSFAFDADATLSKDEPTDTRYWDYGQPSQSGTITNPKGFNGFHYGGAGKGGAGTCVGGRQG